MNIPVIDLFAGPGGLGEGFSRSSKLSFQVAVSIEKDGMAHETLRMRSAHRALLRGAADRSTWALWDQIVADRPWNVVFDYLRESGKPEIAAACKDAEAEAWNLEMGPENRELVLKGIRSRLKRLTGSAQLPRNAVLIGGPPCQAYSIVGRSRNRGTEGYRAEDDHRHFLYREYLNVIAEFQPAVFVMENVKGILSSEVSDRRLFMSITEDLKRPDIALGRNKGLEYVLVALPHGSSGLFDPDPQDYIVRAEDFGVPQARHRVIICGVRKDVFDRAGSVRKLRPRAPSTVGEVISDLPRLRPELSYRGKGIEWRDALSLKLAEQAIRELTARDAGAGRQIVREMESARQSFARQGDPGSGADRLPLQAGHSLALRSLNNWYRDRPLAVLANHESRAHMPADLVRYLFVSSFGKVSKRSPKLGDFPSCLLPEHKNVDRDNLADAIFKDRFRVQVSGQSSMTVTSHIAKDGHAFIHPDPSQCRSLTVREAARLQTFPDSYVFLGNRTSQYTQVGNAVPPMLAVQLADIVADVLERSGFA